MKTHPVPAHFALMSPDDRVAHWAGYLYRGMRWAGEDGHEEISILDAQELARLRAVDPDIDQLMPGVLDILADMWMAPTDAFFAEANQQMGTTFVPNATGTAGSPRSAIWFAAAMAGLAAVVAFIVFRYAKP